MSNSSNSSSDNQQRQFAMRGFYFGAGIPFLLGVGWIVLFNMSLPELKPGDGHCGMGAMPGAILILFGTPTGALIGALTGSAIWVNQSK